MLKILMSSMSLQILCCTCKYRQVCLWALWSHQLYESYQRTYHVTRARSLHLSVVPIFCMLKFLDVTEISKEFSSGYLSSVSSMLNVAFIATVPAPVSIISYGHDDIGFDV